MVDKKNNLIACALVALIASQSAASARPLNDFPRAAPDGRFSTSCSPYGAGTGEKLCVVPFVRLISVPERFQGKLVEITGILGSEGGQPTLYVSRDSYAAGGQLESISIDGEVSPMIATRLRQGVCTTVVGIFDGKYFGHDRNSLGILRQVHDITVCADFHH